MKTKLAVCLLLCCLLSLTSSAQAPQDITVEKDVIYGRVGDLELKMDIAKPVGKPHGAIVCMHGGAWQLGDKMYYEPIIRRLAQGGYVAAAVGYRLAPAHQWPAQIEDVKCAVRYLRKNARKLGIDKDKIGAIGDSAGGHLALLAGLMDPKDNLEGTGGYARKSSKVNAVVSMYGPTDIAAWEIPAETEASIQKDVGKSSDQMMADWLGTADRTADVMKQASPITYVDAEDAPVLLFHGDKDPLVPIAQAQLLQAALEQAGVPHKYVVMEGHVHGWDLLESMPEALAFFDAVLNGKPIPQDVPEKTGAIEQ